MTKRKSKSDDYDIGYAKPPTYTRFPPGQSGNLGGRPTKKLPDTKAPTDSNFDNALRAELDRTLTVEEGGTAKKIKVRDLIPRAQIKSALKGHAIAQQHVMKAIRELEQRDAERELAQAEEEKVKREEEIRVYHFMVQQKEERRRIWSEAETEGKEPDNPWPHPDDILLFPDQQRWHPRGPFDQKDITFYNWCRAERDHLLAYATLQDRSGMKSSEALSNAYMIMWVSYDVMLPLRWQVTADQTSANPLYKLHMMPLKQLRRLVEERREHAKFMQLLAGVPDRWDKDSYKIANSIMKPLLQKRGYRSLAEFEAAYEREGEAMAWR